MSARPIAGIHERLSRDATCWCIRVLVSDSECGIYGPTLTRESLTSVSLNSAPHRAMERSRGCTRSVLGSPGNQDPNLAGARLGQNSRRHRDATWNYG